MPHPRYTEANRPSKGGGHRRHSQEVIDYIHEMAELDGTDSDIMTAIAEKFNGLHVSSGSILKYARDARADRIGATRGNPKHWSITKQNRITELFKLGLKPSQIHFRMHQEKFPIGKSFVRDYLKEQGLIPQEHPRWVKRRETMAKNLGQVQPPVMTGEVEEKVQPEVREHPSMEEATVEVVSLDELLQGFNVKQEVNDIKVTSELETMEMNQVTMVQVYRDALNQIDNVIRPSVVKGLEVALQLQATDSVLEELKFLRSAMEIPNSILESQRADQETTLQQAASNQSQAVMQALYEEQQAKRDVEIQRKAYENANAGEKSLNERG